MRVFLASFPIYFKVFHFLAAITFIISMVKALITLARQIKNRGMRLHLIVYIFIFLHSLNIFLFIPTTFSLVHRNLPSVVRVSSAKNHMHEVLKQKTNL